MSKSEAAAVVPMDWLRVLAAYLNPAFDWLVSYDGQKHPRIIRKQLAEQWNGGR
jgi:hypothetical protein